VAEDRLPAGEDAWDAVDNIVTLTLRWSARRFPLNIQPAILRGQARSAIFVLTGARGGRVSRGDCC
jgi:hypothetical protein